MGKDKDKKKEKVYDGGTLPELTVTPAYTSYKLPLKKTGNGKPRNMSGFATNLGKAANEAAKAAIEKQISKDLSKAAKTALHNPPRL